MTPDECRAYADACTPRVHGDGSINAQHVAIEQTLRRKHGHPSFIAELDGPGRYRPAPAEVPTVMRLECRVQGCRTDYEVPIVYREVQVPWANIGGRLEYVTSRLEVDVEGTLALEAWLRGHLEQHAITAEVLAAGHPDDPGPELVEVVLGDDPEVEAVEEEPEGWRCP